MSTPEDEPFYSGLPMALEELSHEADLPYPLPDGARVVTIEDARASLPEAQNVLMVLQAMSDEAHDLTNELELLLEGYSMTHPHVLEVAEHLGSLKNELLGELLSGSFVQLPCGTSLHQFLGTHLPLHLITGTVIQRSSFGTALLFASKKRRKYWTEQLQVVQEL